MGEHTPYRLEVAVGEEYCFHDTTRVSLHYVVKGAEQGLDESEDRDITLAEVWPDGGDRDIADGHRMALCWNTRDALVAALQEVVYAHDDESATDLGIRIDAVMDNVRAALAAT